MFVRSSFTMAQFIHSIRMNLQSCQNKVAFFIKLDAVKRFLDKKSKFDIRITIKNDEDNRESDGSVKKGGFVERKKGKFICEYLRRS